MYDLGYRLSEENRLMGVGSINEIVFTCGDLY